ncbi:MAG: nicotinamide riboside transporter PnuC [Nannocystaceae bacterium]|nr:nicotinamide riboside transporter PnuC [bacterium]
MSTVWDQLLATSALEWFGTVTGLAAVVLSIRQHRAAWPLFIACYAAYAWLSADARLLAAAGMNGVFVVLSIEGWRSWNRSEDASVEASGRGVWISALGAWVGASAALSIVLFLSGRADAPWLDASATAAGLVAQWLLTRKYTATWAFWLISDVLFMVLYGQAGYWMTVGLFAVFTGLAVHGMVSWHRELEEAAP